MRNFMNKELLNELVSKAKSWKNSLRTTLLVKRSELEQKIKLNLVNYTNNLLRAEIVKQGKNPDAPPALRAPEPTVAEAVQPKHERPRFHTPFVPSWVRDSFKNPNKHVVRNPLPKPPPPPAPLKADVVLSADEFKAVMNDDEEKIQDIFSDEDKWFPLEPKQQDAMADLRAMLADIKEELPEEPSVQVTGGSRAVPAGKKRKAKEKLKAKSAVGKFKRGSFRRVED